MTLRLLSVTVFCVATIAATALAQEQRAPDLDTSIRQLASFDYPVRTSAAQRLRRMPAETVTPALADVVRSHPDQFIRFRALVLLSGFSYSRMPQFIRGLLTDRNDRVREIAYAWLAAHPDRTLAPVLLATLQTEGAEFVRPALIRALAAVSTEPEVQRALLAETGRGLDFFRSAAIAALGTKGASYALDAVAAIAKIEGPLQDDAVMALGRIGDPRASAVLASIDRPSAEVAAAIRAARCLLGDDCAAHIKALSAMIGERDATVPTIRAGAEALATIASIGNEAAASTLISSAQANETPAWRQVALALAGVALRNPDGFIVWLAGLSEGQQSAAAALLQDGFASLENDYAEEQFFAAVRGAYWKATEGAAFRVFLATLTQKLEF